MQLKAISVYLQNKLRMPARRKMSANQGLYKQKGPLLEAGDLQPQIKAANFLKTIKVRVVLSLYCGTQ